MKLARLLKKKAFTLVELIIAMAIMMILIVAAMSMFNPVSSIIKSIDEDVVTNNIADSMTTYIHSKVNTCSTYNIDIYDNTSLTADASADESAAKRCKAILSSIKNPTAESSYCMVLRRKDDTFQLYDFGKITSVAQFTARVNDIEKYALFNNEYYNDVDFRFTFETKSGWCKIGITSLERETGNVVVETRTDMFKLVNITSTPESNPVLKDYTSVGTDKNIVIFYNIIDYTKYTPGA